MSGYTNKVILLGDVDSEVDIRKTNEGTRLLSFGLYTEEAWKDKNNLGQVKKMPSWHKVVVYNPTPEQLEIKRGDKLMIIGKLSTRVYEDKTNTKRYITEVIVTQFAGSCENISKAEDSAKVGNKWIEDEIPF